MKLKEGTKIEGFCGGHFGRDSYDDRLCFKIGSWEGVDYALFYTETYRYKGVFAVSGDELKSLKRYLKEDYDEQRKCEEEMMQ